MSTKTKAGKLTLAALAGVLAIGAAACTGGGHAKATAPHPATNGVHAAARLATATAPQGPHNHINYVQGGGGGAPWVANRVDFYLYNDTPYTWTLDPSQTANESGPGNWQLLNWAGSPPPQTLQPGEVAHLQHWSQSQGDTNISVNDSWVGYTFTDVDGGQHLAQFYAGGGWNQKLQGFSTDWDAGSGSWTNSTAVYHMQLQPSAPVGSVGAVLNNPAVLTIDAQTNPGGAAQAMSHFLESDPNTRKFVPKLGADGKAVETWTTSPKVPGSATLLNLSSAEGELTAQTGTTNTESTQIGEELSWETELSILGVVNVGLEGSIDSSQKWTTSTEVSEGNTMTVKPGEKGWWLKYGAVANVTGDFTFTVFNGQLIYHVNNATASMEGVADPANAGKPGTTFMSHTESATP